ncbi:MAG: hypothetical protein R2752_00580 [Vicinamibacterales bacterium]
MKRAHVALALVAALGAAATASAQTPPQSPPAAEKPAATPAPASIAGKWSVTVQSPQGTMMSTLEVKQEGKKITGTLSSDMGVAPVAGEYADGKLEFTISMDTGGGAMEIWFGGAFKDDGTMAGTLDFGQGEIPWTAKAIKDK